MALIGGIIAAIYVVVHYGFIQPEYIETIREQSYTDMIERSPNMTEDDIEKGTKLINIFASKSSKATMILMRSLFSGFLISLITGAIMKKE